MLIVPGSASKKVAENLSELLNCGIAKVNIKEFADGERYVRLEDEVKDEDLIIIQNTYPDGNIIETFLLQDASADAGARSITLVIPYYGYGRQDRKFLDGEAVSARILAELLSSLSDAIILVDPHKQHILNFFKVPAYSCSANEEIAKYLSEKVDIVLAPDKGAMERAKEIAKITNCDCDFLEKRRIDDRTVEIEPKEVEVDGKRVAIVDDIISTGGTMAKAVEEMKKQGAKWVCAACVHGLFVKDAIKKLEKAGADEIVSTDSIYSRFSKVSVAPAIVKKLKELMG
ncbi:MAG: ribose-phosphate diphosphokinase [Thermoplasmata archaeon]|nr:ribose-phosphate diphosphokinase [Thermoplasmata archaeon]